MRGKLDNAGIEWVRRRPSAQSTMRSGERYELLQRVRNTLDSVSSSQQFPELHVDG